MLTATTVAATLIRVPGAAVAGCRVTHLALSATNLVTARVVAGLAAAVATLTFITDTLTITTAAPATNLATGAERLVINRAITVVINPVA